MRNREFQSIFNKHAETIWVHLAKETEIDPIEHTVDYTYVNPIPIKAIVMDLTATQAKWKMPGIELSRAKIVIIDVGCRDLIELSKKITIDNVDYLGWKERGKIQIRKYMNYLEVLVYTEN